MRITDSPPDSAKYLEMYFKTAKIDKLMYSEGVKWYGTANSQLAALGDTYNVPFPVVCGIAARLSPSISWSRNIKATHNLLRGDKTIDGYARNVDVARKLLAGQYGVTDCGVSTSFPKTARKTFSFYHNLLHGNKSHHVTIDRWMIRATMSKDEATSLPSEFAIAPGAYTDISHDVTALSKKYKLKALQVQACIWLAIRAAWKKKEVAN